MDKILLNDILQIDQYEIKNTRIKFNIYMKEYAAGIMNGYLHRNILSPGNYQFATDLYDEYIKPKLRHHAIGTVCGYGVIDIPKRTAFRPQLEGIFDPKE